MMRQSRIKSEQSPLLSMGTSKVFESDDKISSDVASLFEVKNRRKRRNKKAIKFLDSLQGDEGEKKVAEFGMRSGEWPDNFTKSYGKVWESNSAKSN